MTGPTRSCRRERCALVFAHRPHTLARAFTHFRICCQIRPIRPIRPLRPLRYLLLSAQVCISAVLISAETQLYESVGHLVGREFPMS